MRSIASPTCRMNSNLLACVHKLPPLRFVATGPVIRAGSESSSACRASDIAQSFLDLTNLVAPATSSKGAFDDLAYTIGRETFADLSGWHLFLKDMKAYPNGPKMNTVVAEQLGAQVLTDGCKEADVVEFLKKVPVKVGQGKVTLSLEDVMPKTCVQDIVRACEDFERRA